MTKTGTPTSCTGTNHSDRGTFADCGSCGRLVVRRENGAVAEPRLTLNGVRGYFCWIGHECDGKAVEAFRIDTARKIVSGEVTRGALVSVVKGRKVPVGTVGVVRVLTTGQYGDRVALAVEGTEGLVWTNVSNVAINDAAAIDAAREVVAEYDARVAAWAARESAANEAIEAYRTYDAPGERDSDERRAWAASDAYTNLLATVDAAFVDLQAVRAERGW